MWLKNVKRFFPASITVRLTVLYALSTILLISVVSLLCYSAMYNIMYKADQEFLSDQVDALQENLSKKPNSSEVLRDQVVDIPDALSDSIYHYYIRVLDQKNKEIISTPGMNEIIHKNKSSYLPSINKFRWRVIEGKTYLVFDSKIRFGKNNWPVQAILDVSYQYQLIREYRYSVYRNQIILIFVLSVIAAVLIGYFIAKRAMKRLRDLTKATRKITASSLSNRVDPLFWPAELQDLAHSFNLMLDRMESSFLRLTQFSDDLAHELRTPINNLLGETEIALTRQSTLEECREVMQSNLEELQRISQIIENLLFLARSENLQVEIQKIPVRVENEIDLLKEYYSALAEEKNIMIKAEGRAQLNVEPVMFRRMLNNLLSNAIKYTPNCGAITIHINDSSKGVEISITDNGIGIAVEHQAYLFSRFYRVDPNRSQKSGGVGLGLAIVKSIVDLHNGSIKIVSQPEKGTSVILFFPK